MTTTEITLKFSKYEWREKVSSCKSNIEKALKIIDLIDQANKRYNNEIDTAMTYGIVSNELRARAIHRADISKRAHARLVNYFNNLVPEIQL